MVLENEIEEIEFEDPPTKTFTVREVWEALEKNGLHHIRSEWLSTNSKGKIVGGCALGQAAYNLGVPFDSDLDGFDIPPKYEEYDYNEGNLHTALNQFSVPEKYQDFGHSAGDVIISINDEPARTVSGMRRFSSGNKAMYKYNYAKVVEMAKEILEPHFDKTIELPHFDY